MPQSVVLPHVLVCFSSIRWNFLYQRPQHLLTRFAAEGVQVIYIESKVPVEATNASFEKEVFQNVQVIRPLMPRDLTDAEYIARMQALLEELLGPGKGEDAIFWYYNPAAIRYTNHLSPALTVYDCIGDPEALPNAHEDISRLERQLMDRADVVFTPSNTVQKSRRKYNMNIHVLPSAVDREHFAQARCTEENGPEDQRTIPHPRLGFYGMINENIDTKLLKQVATLRPDWHFVFIGPVMEGCEAALPEGDNIHYLGAKSYEDLPHYLCGWDLALVPLKEDSQTRRILPAKVPEYLAAGVRVIASPLEEIVNNYGRKGLVQVVSGAEVFVAVAQSLLEDSGKEKASWLRQVDAELSGNSWDKVFQQMQEQLLLALQQKRPARKKSLRTVGTALVHIFRETTALMKLPGSKSPGA